VDSDNILRTTQRKIGKTLYNVRAIQSENARETAEQILVRLIKNNALSVPENRMNTGKIT